MNLKLKVLDGVKIQNIQHHVVKIKLYGYGNQMILNLVVIVYFKHMIKM